MIDRGILITIRQNTEQKLTKLACYSARKGVGVERMQFRRCPTLSNELHSRPRICTPFTRITRVLREYYVRKANYAHLRVTCAYLRVTYLINIHKQR